jgi:hypothetical protein
MFGCSKRSSLTAYFLKATPSVFCRKHTQLFTQKFFQNAPNYNLHSHI